MPGSKPHRCRQVDLEIRHVVVPSNEGAQKDLRGERPGVAQRHPELPDPDAGERAEIVFVVVRAGSHELQIKQVIPNCCQLDAHKRLLSGRAATQALQYPHTLSITFARAGLAHHLHRCETWFLKYVHWGTCFLYLPGVIP